MRRSIGMLQPSAFEGWSTVVEDAKTLGKTILASSIEVHREQLGPLHPHYLDVADPEAWAREMQEVWQGGTPGPSPAGEASGMGHLNSAAPECGRSFVCALRSAMVEG
jgi:hypothetical protein